MLEVISAAISILALAVSVTTAWLTLFRKGTIKMTRPTVVYFGPDGGFEPGNAPSKIFIRTLLFSTSRRGRVVEHMHLRVTLNETNQNFNVWVYGEEKLSRGSGLFVGEAGIVANHHFLEPRDGSAFRFVRGSYKIEVYAKLLGDKAPLRLFSEVLNVSIEDAKEMAERDRGLYFDWGPDAGRYVSHVDEPRKVIPPPGLVEMLSPSTLPVPLAVSPPARPQAPRRKKS